MNPEFMHFDKALICVICSITFSRYFERCRSCPWCHAPKSLMALGDHTDVPALRRAVAEAEKTPVPPTDQAIALPMIASEAQLWGERP
jgi:hypothetical protein